MPDTATIAVFAVAAVTLLLIPGPAVLYIVSRSVGQGRAAGLASVCGIHVGSLLHVAAAALGLSALLVSSALAYDTVRYLGAAYLVWLGVQRLLARDEDARPARAGGDRLGRIFAQGVVVNILNPKTALFFFAFLPQFVDASAGTVRLQVAVLGATFVGLGLVTDSAYALLASTSASFLRGRRRVARASRLVSGGVLVGLGVTTALAGSRSSR
ncbi:MAG TPA: LysE family translocator [Actinomycetota bacterium]|nr:LysE family translocator [Actinomycetota bacterium]